MSFYPLRFFHINYFLIKLQCILVITSILMVGQHYIEAYYGKGVDNLSPAPVNMEAAKAAAAGMGAPKLSGGGESI